MAGLGFVVGTVHLTMMVADWFSGKALATAMGILVMSWLFGIAFGQLAPPLAGWRFDRSVDPYRPLLLSAGLSAGAMALFRLFRLFRWVRQRLLPA